MSSSMSISSVVISRYAGTLLDLAEEGKSVSKIQKDLEDLAGMISSSDDLAQAISSPMLSRERQEAIVADISSKAKLQKLTKNFLGVLVQNRRLNALEAIIKEFKKQVSVRSGEVSVRVETATALSASQEKAMKKNIEGALGRAVSIEVGVTPEILGGTVVTIGSYMIDDSVRRKLERLNVSLKSGANQNKVNLEEVV